MDDIFSVVPPGDDGVVEEGEELQLGAAVEGLQVGQLLQGVVGQDQRAQVGQTKLQTLANPDNPVVVQHEVLHSVHVGESIQLSDLIVAEVYRVVLVQSRPEVLDDRNLVASEVQLSVPDGVDVLTGPLYDVGCELHHFMLLEIKPQNNTAGTFIF